MWANVLNVLSRGRGRVILTSHSRESAVIAGRSAPLVRRLVRLTYPRADAVVAVSSAVKRDLVDNLGVPEARVFTIYNTIDAGEIERLAREPLAPDLDRFMNAPCVVTAGTLRPEKGQWHLLRAFAALKREYATARLIVMGDGPLHDYLTRLARDLGLSTHVHGEPNGLALHDADVVFLGFQRNPFAVLSRAAVFAFPSLSEGFGNVIIEALACGAPVISADCPSGPREILAPERPDAPAPHAPEFASAGVLMPPFDGKRREASVPLTATEALWTNLLATALAKGDLKARYQEAGRARARAFTLEAIGPEWRQLLGPP
jgi:glycosyltransferase involved in cell wall biosynthesis